MCKGKTKVPSCQLRATLSHDWRGCVPERSHLVTLEGAKGPDNEMLFAFDAVDFSNQGKFSCWIFLKASIYYYYPIV